MQFKLGDFRSWLSFHARVSQPPLVATALKHFFVGPREGAGSFLDSWDWATHPCYRRRSGVVFDAY
jgi:hypothetical protein